MSYQVLARKWRPYNFETLVGQTHVVRAMSNALDENRLHHAYLFSGTRGVGKTTIARIIAKALNCEKGVSKNPCNKCGTCTAINEGRFIDLIEVDAASRTKVEDTRELLDNVQYAPTQGRYKIYLIDEVHMLSGHSFNALLKTLEEPPPHVKFLLATTDPQKLPITVLSRCLQFHLKNLPIELISNHLQYILNEEKIKFEVDALIQIARAANGSMRDALSLLDQAISYCSSDLKNTEVSQLLGTVSRDAITPLLNTIADKNAEALLQHIKSLAEFGADFQSVLDTLLDTLHYIAIAQLAPKALDDTFTDKETALAFAERFSKEEIQLYYQIALIGKKDLPLAPDPQTGLEMVMLRMLAFDPSQSAPLKQTPKKTSTEKLATTVKKTTAPVTTAVNIDKADLNWDEIIPHLNLTGMSKILANNCILQSFEDNVLILRLSDDQSALLNDRQKTRLQETLSTYLNQPIKLIIELGETKVATPAENQREQSKLEHQEAYASVANDDGIKNLMSAFDASLNEDAVKPIAN